MRSSTQVISLRSGSSSSSSAPASFTTAWMGSFFRVMRILAVCVRTMSRKAAKSFEISVACHRRCSLISDGRIARRSAFFSSSPNGVPPASPYSFSKFSNSAMPSSTLSRFLMGLKCIVLTSRRKASRRIERP